LIPRRQTGRLCFRGIFVFFFRKSIFEKERNEMFEMNKNKIFNLKNEEKHTEEIKSEYRKIRIQVIGYGGT
jgi:hypothetical protein